MTEYEKFRQVCREARGTGVLLGVLIVFWLAAGFGAYAVWGSEPAVFGLPVWAIGGTIGVWLFAIVGVWVLLRTTFCDMDLDDAAGSSADTAAAGGLRGGERDE